VWGTHEKPEPTKKEYRCRFTQWETGKVVAVQKKSQTSKDLNTRGGGSYPHSESSQALHQLAKKKAGKGAGDSVETRKTAPQSDRKQRKKDSKRAVNDMGGGGSRCSKIKTHAERERKKWA